MKKTIKNEFLQFKQRNHYYQFISIRNHSIRDGKMFYIYSLNSGSIETHHAIQILYMGLLVVDLAQAHTNPIQCSLQKLYTNYCCLRLQQKYKNQTSFLHPMKHPACIFAQYKHNASPSPRTPQAPNPQKERQHEKQHIMKTHTSF